MPQFFAKCKKSLPIFRKFMFFELILIYLIVTKNNPQKLVQYLIPILRQICITFNFQLRMHRRIREGFLNFLRKPSISGLPLRCGGSIVRFWPQEGTGKQLGGREIQSTPNFFQTLFLELILISLMKINFFGKIFPKKFCFGNFWSRSSFKIFICR